MKLILIVMALFSSVAATNAADVTDTIRQFTAPCEFQTLQPVQAQKDLVDTMKDYLNLGFKLVSLTKVEKAYTLNTCVYTFFKQ